MEGNNVIFTTCVGYEVPHLRPFVESCRRHFAGEVYAFVGRLSEEALNYLYRFNIKTIEIGTLYHDLDQMILGRFVCFFDFIVSSRLEFDHCLFLDMRDVFFQSDAFKEMSASVYLKAYTSDKTFGRDKTEQQWMLQAYGPDILASLMSKRVLCAGTTLASFAGALQYLKFMVEASKQFSVRYFGLDESIHNVVIYKYMQSNAEIGINRLSDVQTMNLQEQFRFNDSWQVINDDGKICPILHQYDRHEPLRRLVYSINDQEDPFLPEFYKMKKILRSRSRTARQLIRLIALKQRGK